MSAGLLVAIVAAPLVLTAAIVGWVYRFVRRYRRRLEKRIVRDLADSPAVRGPQGRALYMGGTGSYPRISSNGKLALTATHLRFWSVIGIDVAVPLAEVLEVDTTTNGSRSRPVPHRPHLRLTTSSGKVVVDVDDGPGWAEAVRAQLVGVARADAVRAQLVQGARAGAPGTG